MAQPNYVATRSACSAVTFRRIILFFLIIPIILMIVDGIAAKKYRIEFYDDHIIEKSGILSKREKRSAFNGVVGVSVSQSLWQRLWKCGDVHVDVIGKWDINTNGIANPQGLQNYLETKFVKNGQITNIMAN